MVPKRPSRKVLRSLCADLGPDDGVDPRDLIRKDTARKASDHRARRLCRQVAETLGGVLAGELGDDVLRGLEVVAVEPGPDVGRLLITVRLPEAHGEADPALVLERLAGASGRLRAAVAATITRRKAPTLAFRVAIPGG